MRSGLDPGEFDWASDQNYFYLNPRFPTATASELMALLPACDEAFSGHLFMMSSGTTAQSMPTLKWVALSKSGFLVSADAVNQALKATREDVWLHLLPDFHVGGLAIRARCFQSQARAVSLLGWEVSEFIRAIEQHQVTLTSLVPTQVFDLCQQEARCPKSIRAVLVGGGALSAPLCQRAQDLGWPIQMTYAMTETCSTVGLSSESPLGREVRFQVLPHFEVAETSGVLKLRGPSLLSAYIYRDLESRVQVHDPRVQGWFQTSDRGTVWDREFELVGREADLIKVGGESVEMGRLNRILDELRIQFSISADLALIPLPDPRLGHVVGLVSDAHLTQSQADLILAQWSARVLPFEKIRKWVRLDVIPRSPLGKLIVHDCLARV
jgi:O-succinylbenzoic acid--CoA ligase